MSEEEKRNPWAEYYKEIADEGGYGRELDFEDHNDEYDYSAGEEDDDSNEEEFDDAYANEFSGADEYGGDEYDMFDEEEDDEEDGEDDEDDDEKDREENDEEEGNNNQEEKEPAPVDTSKLSDGEFIIKYWKTVQKSQKSLCDKLDKLAKPLTFGLGIGGILTVINMFGLAWLLNLVLANPAAKIIIKEIRKNAQIKPY